MKRRHMYRKTGIRGPELSGGETTAPQKFRVSIVQLNRGVVLTHTDKQGSKV